MASRHAADEDLDLEPLLIDMQRRVHFELLPKEPIVVQFAIREFSLVLCSCGGRQRFARATRDTRSPCAFMARLLRLSLVARG